MQITSPHTIKLLRQFVEYHHEPMAADDNVIELIPSPVAPPVVASPETPEQFEARVAHERLPGETIDEARVRLGGSMVPTPPFETQEEMQSRHAQEAAHGPST